ncbi:MAG: hypothetical protein HY841_07990 [Bacteroidetes bacterium]|nr:hypothetical protein [Bacteroidota bacterium]
MKKIFLHVKKKSGLKPLFAFVLLTPTLMSGLQQSPEQTWALDKDEKFKLLKSIPASFSSITTDNLGNSYLFNGTLVEKYDGDGNLLKNFSNKNLGNITSVDASNSLKVLLFYKSFQQILLLDNMFAPSGNSISLDALGYNQTSLVCSSHDNGFWIFSKQNSELIRFDQNLQKTQQTGNISQLTGMETNPDFVTEQYNKVFMNDSLKGILVFDIYGTYNKIIPIKGLHHFQISNDDIIYFKEGKLKSYNMKTLEDAEISLPEINIIDARTEKEKLYLLKQKSLDIYHVKNQK